MDPGIVAQQMEGAIVFGLTAALYGRIDIEHGAISSHEREKKLNAVSPAHITFPCGLFGSGVAECRSF